jgi:hypothetical protein
VGNELLYEVNEWVICLGLFALLLAGFEAGFRYGARLLRGMAEPPSDSQITTLQSAILVILGLLLGFTFSMSVSRFEARKQFVVDEANAIGTAYLRTKVLPEPRRGRMATLFRRYVDARLSVSRGEPTPDQLSAAIAESNALQGQIWALAVEVAREDPRSPTAGLLLQSINEVIDLHEKRLAAVENHVPETILLLLAVVATLGMAMTGVHSAVAKRRYLLPVAVVAFLISFTVVIILDIDRPRRGLIQVSQGSLVRLRDSLNDEPAP